MHKVMSNWELGLQLRSSFPEECNCQWASRLSFFFTVFLQCWVSYITSYLVASLQQAEWRVLQFNLFYEGRMTGFQEG